MRGLVGKMENITSLTTIRKITKAAQENASTVGAAPIQSRS